MPRVTEEYRQRRIYELHRATWWCVATNGMAHLTMDDIMEASNFSAGMIYNYYPGRDELVAAAIESALAYVRTALAEATDSLTLSPADLFAAVTAAVARASETEPWAVATAWAAATSIPSPGRPHEEATERYERFLATVEAHAAGWQQSGAAGEEATPRHLATLFVSILIGYFTQVSVYDSTDAAEQIIALRALTNGRSPSN